MSRTPWTRDQKIGLAALLFVAATCIATVILVPEVRHWMGLDPSDDPPNLNNNSNTRQTANINASANKSTASGGHVPAPIQPQPSGESERKKLAGIGFQEGAFVNLGNFRIHLLDLAAYSSGNLYIKFRVCNSDSTTRNLHELYVWYTPRDQDAVNWSFKKMVDSFVSLKPGECRLVGDWSEDTNDFQLRRPLGVLHLSTRSYAEEVSIDLNDLEGRNMVRF